MSLAGAFVAACHAYSRERKNVPPTFDWIDFCLLQVSGSFSGFVGFLVALWQVDELPAVLAITALTATSGYKSLRVVHSILLEALRSRLVHPASTHVPTEDKE